MRFRTEYEVKDPGFRLDPGKKVMLAGSCFAGNICRKMRDSLWDARTPLGTLYNPLSISVALESVMSEDGERMFRESLFESEGIWRSWFFDSVTIAGSREEVISEFRKIRGSVAECLGEAEAVFVTFGTARCYWLEGRGDYPVANCHKQPAASFSNRRLSVGEIVEIWTSLTERLKEKYPRLKVIFTVSPVRHIKDGFEENSRSKATLLLAVEELIRREGCGYFPAFEIVGDDLRDYRFYASDLVHPSEECVEYIWEKFREMYLTPEGEAALKEGDAIRRGYAHRPIIAAKREGCGERDEKERARLAALADRHARLIERHPGML